jgi:hypothetical protein
MRPAPATEAALPFTPASFTALIPGTAFTLWHYRTADTRAAVTAPGYFAAVAGSLKPGDLLVLQSVDALALLPIRTGPALGPGTTLDGPVGPLTFTRTVAQRLSQTQAVAAVTRTIVLDPIANAVVAGAAFAVSATVTGPVAQVTFTLLDRTGQAIPPARTVAVVGGAASASFTAPAIGTGYRIRAQDAADATLSVLGPAISVGADLQLLLLETGSWLLLESGGVLKQ